ncbi:MAG: PEP-CTERM sorting domain-containing protein [Proteobacteria bacterium]|nr:PEP-CTERM sorting domain-containing protein [Pseudomonadota bacterium]
MKVKKFVQVIVSVALITALSIPVFADTNVALDKPAVANSTYLNYTADLAFDGVIPYGDKAAFDSPTPPYYWVASGWASPTNPLGLMVDLGGLYSVDSVKVYGSYTNYYGSNYYVGYNLYYLNTNTPLDLNSYSNNNSLQWTLLGSGINYDDPVTYMNEYNNLGGIAMRALKFESTNSTHWAGLMEMEVYTNSVPEPTTMLLLGLGLVGLAGIRKKFKY